MAIQTAPQPTPPRAQTRALEYEEYLAIRPRRFTVDEYEQILKAGIIGEDERVELIHGEIAAMSPIGGPHSWFVTLLYDLLRALYPKEWVVRSQCPIRLSDSEPQPDVAVYRPASAGRIQQDNPTGQDAMLLIEVSETSLTFDRQVKAPLYAAEGAPESWIVDLQDRVIEVYREPAAGGYGSMKRHGAGDRIVLPGIPDASLKIDEVFRPRQ